LLQWHQSTATGGTITHDADKALVNLAVTSSNGSQAIMQSKKNIRYQPGFGQAIAITFVLGAGQANTYRRIGLFDANNGFFLEDVNNEWYFVVRDKTTGSVVNDAIPQSSWNIEKLNGVGKSGITLDKTTGQILWIDFQALYMGRARFGFDIDGQVYWCHEFNHANIIAAPYIQNATLPVRIEITNAAAAAGTCQLSYICASVWSYGGSEEESGFPFSADRGVSSLGVTSRRPILSIRPTVNFNSIKNKVQFILENISVNATTNILYYEVILNPATFTGASWGAVDTDSAMEFDISATALTGGRKIYSDYVSASAQTQSNQKYQLLKIDLGLNYAEDTADILTIVGTAVSGTSNALASISWKEVY
jgi:hypothetical protein